MKRRCSLGLSLVVLGLMTGWGDRFAHGQTKIWDQVYPDAVPVVNSNNGPVGVASGSTFVFAGGKSVQSASTPGGLSGPQQFTVVKHLFPAQTPPASQVTLEAIWPPTARTDSDTRVVVDMAAVKQGSNDGIWLAGHQPGNDTRFKMAVVKFESTPGKLQVGWSRFEDGSSTANLTEQATALSVGIDGTSGDPSIAAVVGRSFAGSASNSTVAGYVYDATTGNTVGAIKWQSTATSNDVPVGVSVLSSRYVVVTGTTDRRPGSSQSYNRLFCFLWDTQTGTVAGSPVYIDGGTGSDTYTLDAAASATALTSVAGTTGFTAVVATRTWTSGSLTGRKEIFVQAFETDWTGSPTLSAGWDAAWTGDDNPDGVSTLNVPTCVTVAGFPGVIHTEFRVFVGGTAKATSSSKADMVTLQYHSGVLEWYDVWHRYNTLAPTTDNVPAKIAYIENHDPPPSGSTVLRRIYVVGSTQSTAGDFDIVTQKYATFATSPTPGGRVDPLWGRLSTNAIWAGSNGDDFGVSVWPDQVIDQTSGGNYVDFFVTGISQGSTTNTEWVTVRYRDSAP